MVCWLELVDVVVAYEQGDGRGAGLPRHRDSEVRRARRVRRLTLGNKDGLIMVWGVGKGWDNLYAFIGREGSVHA